MNDKEFFSFMIRHYQIVNYELSQKEQELLNAKNKNASPFYIPFRKEKDGIRYINFLPSFSNNYGYCTFHLTIEADILKITEKGIIMYRKDDGTFVCTIKDILYILQSESEHLYNLVLFKSPHENDRLPSNYFHYYFNSINCYIKKLKYENYATYFIGEKKGIDRYGVFAYSRLYSDINWSFDIIEKYKEKIVGWKLLIEKGNLFWDEEKIEYYYHYIKEDAYIKHSNQELSFLFPIKQFNNIGCLSWGFLMKHFDDIDFRAYLQTGNFDYDVETLYILCYNVDFRCCWDDVLNNQSYIWTIEFLRFLYGIDEARTSLLKMDEKRSISAYNLIKNSKEAYMFDYNFMKILREGELQYGYSDEFTFKNIINNVENWNKVVVDTFKGRLFGNHYTYKGRIKTMWDFYVENKYIELTYELSKFLYNIEIILGDFSDKEYSEHHGWTEYGRYQYKINGLKAFHNKHISSEKELSLIIADRQMVNLFFSHDFYNQDVVNYIIDTFFSDFSVKDWKKTIYNIVNTSNQHSYVDLGLNVLWATCNIGAGKPTDGGDGVIWGEPYPNSNAQIDDNIFNMEEWKNITGLSICKDKESYYYGATDIAGTRFDAARMSWGEMWRMPRIEDFQELLDKCTWEELESNTKVYKITGPNGNSIFLPIISERYYLTSMRHDLFPYIYVLHKDCSYYKDVDRRPCGNKPHCIRPVRDKNILFNENHI